MSQRKISTNITDIVLVGLFAAITLLGIQLFRIPLPAAVGSPFIHFGNSFAVLGFLLLGGKRGALAAAIGLGLFDVLNGYGFYAINTIVANVVVATVVTVVFTLFRCNDKNLGIIALAAASGGLAHIAYDLIFDTIFKILEGSQFKPAAIAAFASIPATAINAVSTVIIVTLLYIPLKKGLEIFESNKGLARL